MRVRKPYSSGIGSGAGTAACERGNIGQAVRADNVIPCNPEWLLERLDLYKCRGVVPQTVFQTLMKTYEAERAQKAAVLPELEQKAKAQQENRNAVDRWLEIIRRYTEITELDETILFELVDRIEVGEARRENGVRICDIRVFYRYVGNVDDALNPKREAV